VTNFTSVAAYLVKKLWLLLAILLVVFALLLSAARYALPQIEHNKHLLENYINQRYGVNLTIDSVHAVWQRTGPSIVLNSVSLAQNNSSPVALDIRQVYVELDFWQSIAQQMISSTRFELRGLKLDIDADRFERADDNDFPVVDALKGLFLEQLQSFSLEDGEVVVSRDSELKSFNIDRLSWNNRGLRHQGLGQIRVTELSSNSASFIIDITGTREAFDGVFYARAEALDISPWVGDLLNTKRPLTESRANFEVWADIQSNGLTGVQARFDNSLLEWGGDDYSSLFTAIRGGNIQALPTAEGWNVRVDKLIVDSNNETLVTDLVGEVTNAGDLLINTVKPVQLNPFLMLLPLVMDDTGEDEIRALNPNGQLATLQVQVRNGKPELAAKILDLSWTQTDSVPGLSALDADIYWYKNNGAVYLESVNSTLSADRIIKQNLAVNTFSANLFVYPEGEQEQKQWKITGKNLLLDTDALVVNPEFSANLTTGELDIFASIEPIALNTVSQLFPVSVMGKNTDAFLTRAFAGEGDVSKVDILWHGKPKNFPFADNTGIFQAHVDIQDSDFVFSSKWPALTELDLSVYFHNGSLVMESESGKLAGIQIGEMSAAIPRLHPDSTLTIYANGAGTGEALTSLMTQSSIASSLGRILDEEVQVTGPLSANLKLDIPLRGKNIRATGDAHLVGNPVYIPSTKMLFDNTKGSLHFDNANIDGTGLSAELLNQSVVVGVKGVQSSQYDLNVDLKGHWHLHPLAKYVKSELIDYVDGETDWQASVDVVLSKSQFSYKGQLSADLTEVVSVLPAPFYSAQGSDLPLQLFSEGNLQASTINATLGDNIQFDGVLPHQEMQFSRAHLSLGDAELDNRGTGFSIAANLPQADVEEWFTALHTLIAGSKSGNKSEKSNPGAATDLGARKANLFGVPSRVFVTTDTLTLAEHTLTNVALTAREQDKDWLLQVDAKEARGTIRVNADVMAQGVEINADYLALNSPQTEPEATTNLLVEEAGKQDSAYARQLDPLDLPPIYFYCRLCRKNDIDLGEITLDAVKTDEGIHIRQFLMRSKDAAVNATGYWQHEGNDIITSVTGELTSPDAGQMLKQHGVSSGIKDSEATVKFELDWPSSPFELTPTTVTGNIDWSLTDGYLTELSDKGSRIFTLFSLNSLVRKLSLDFRDVFASGFFYDKMGGTLQIADGRAYTDDTEIDGGAGEIEINGYTNLATGELNYNVSFAPNVTGNLPILVYFLATPPTALAALALDKVLTSAKVISNVNYSVTGTISDPKFDEVKRASKDISLPANVSPEDTSPQDRPLTEDDVRRVNMEIIDG